MGLGAVDRARARVCLSLLLTCGVGNTSNLLQVGIHVRTGAAQGLGEAMVAAPGACARAKRARQL